MPNKIAWAVNFSFFHTNTYTVKATDLLIKVLNELLIWQKIFLVRGEYIDFFIFPHTVCVTLWNLRNCITIFWIMSVKTTYLVKSFTIKLISRNNSQVIQKFCKHKVWKLRKFTLSLFFWQKFRQSIMFCLLSKELNSRNFSVFLQPFNFGCTQYIFWDW